VGKWRSCGSWAWLAWRRHSFGGTSLLSSSIKVGKRHPDFSSSCTAKGREAKDSCCRKGVSHWISGKTFSKECGEKDMSLQILSWTRPYQPTLPLKSVLF